MKWISFFVFMVFFSCTQMKENYRERVCHYDGAYEEGSNDASSGEPMRGSEIAHKCPDRVKADVRKGYRDGYTQAKATRPTANVERKNIKEDRRQGRNLYNRTCITSFGKQVCGYGCIESYGKAKCARHPGNNCLDEFGKIVCGENCRQEGGRVLCDYRE